MLKGRENAQESEVKASVPFTSLTNDQISLGVGFAHCGTLSFDLLFMSSNSTCKYPEHWEINLSLRLSRGS